MVARGRIQGLWLLMAMVLGLAVTSHAETDVSSKVQVVKGVLGYDRLAKQSYLTVAVKNTSTNVLLTPIKVVVDSVSPSTVKVANADGTTVDGKPYYLYTATNGKLPAGGSIAAKSWKFANPTATKFSYATRVMAYAIVEIINGITVPPAPDATTNAASLEGVDSNSNELRDDVERMVAQEFGSNITFYAKAKNYAITEQTAIINPTPETISAHLDLVRCESDDKVLDDLKKITEAIINTPERRKAYAQSFAGVTITKEGCQQ